MRKKPSCKRCNGTGLEPDHHETGKQMRALREETGRSLRSVASAIGISAPYLSDMELGRRGWSSDMILKVTSALNKKGTK